MINRTLILTSTIAPLAIDIKHIDVISRKKEAIESVIFYAKTELFSRILFCDNSGNSIKKDVEKICKGFNILYDEIIISRGKDFYRKFSGYKSPGEVEKLILAANFLKNLNVKNTYKITARYKIKNINEIVEKFDNYENVFFSFYPNYIRKCSVYTSIYKADLTLLSNMLSFSWSNYEKKHEVSIEHMFGKYLCTFTIGSKVKNFKLIPNISAVSGTAGVNFGERIRIRERITLLAAQFLGLGYSYKLRE